MIVMDCPGWYLYTLVIFWYRSALKWNHIPPLGPPLPPLSPNLAGEFGALLGRGGPDHLHGCRYCHLVGFPLHAEYGCEPLAQAGRALRCGVVLAGPASHAQAFENHAQAGVAGAAIPDQVFRRGVLLVAVQVAYFNVAAASAKGADLLARWRVAVGTIPEGTVCDLAGFLARLPAPPGLDQSSASSPLSSSPLSSSSSSSPCKTSRALPIASASSSLLASGVYASSNTEQA